eukprot:gene33499-2403_t
MSATRPHPSLLAALTAMPRSAPGHACLALRGVPPREKGTTRARPHRA